jgi:hypothetical protein
MGTQAVDLELSGPTSLQGLGPGQRSRFDFAIQADKETLAAPRPVVILVVGKDGRMLAHMNLLLTKPFENHD